MWAVSSEMRAQPLASAFAGDRAMHRPAVPSSSRRTGSRSPSRIREPEVEECLDSLSICDLLGPAFLAGPDSPPRIPPRVSQVMGGRSPDTAWKMPPSAIPEAYLADNGRRESIEQPSHARRRSLEEE